MNTNNMKIKGNSNNAGLSLVEVIVSMLILALLVTPLLRTFIVSAQANLSSRSSQYATNVAQNTLEGLKLYGAENSAKQFNNKLAFNVVPASVLKDAAHDVGFYETNSVFAALAEAFRSVNDSGEFVGNTGKKYYYVINGIKEGTGLFDVRIYLNAASYYKQTERPGKQNDYKMPDLSDLDVKTSALIHPNVDSIKSQYDTVAEYIVNWDNSWTYEDTALTYFLQRHISYVELLNIQIVLEIADIREQNAQITKDNDINGTTEPLLPVPALIPTLSGDELKEYVERKTIINITKSGDKYLVGCDIEYRLNQKKNGSHIALICDGSLEETERKAIETVKYEAYTTKEFSDLKSIYLYHIPLTTDYRKDTILVNNNTGTKINAYIVEQTSIVRPGAGAIKDKIYIDVSAIDISEDIIFYTNANLEVDPDREDLTYQLIYDKNYNLLLIQDLDSYDRIYEVEVEVYQSGTDKKLVSLTSTISK